MKKTITFFVSVLVMSILITGCSANTTSNNLKEGSYKVTYDEADSRDWKAFLTFDVKNGEIKNVNFDYEGVGPNEGKLKTEDEPYNEAMQSAANTNPKEYSKLLEDSLEESQDVTKIDAVSGATTSTNTFIEFAKEGIKAAKKGNTETVVVEQDE